MLGETILGRYYKDKEDCPFDPERAVIFKIRNSPKQSYYVRIRKEGKGRGYFQASLDCLDRDTALVRARDHWREMIRAETRGIVYRRTRFDELFERFLSDYPWRSDSRKRRSRLVYDRYFSSFFGNTDIQSIDQKRYKEYMEYRCAYWKRKKELNEPIPYNVAFVPSKRTLLSERQILNQFLRWCQAKGYLDSIPYFDWDFEKMGLSVNTKKTRGKAIEYNQYQAIISKLREYAKDGDKNAPKINGKIGTGFNDIHRFSRWRLYYFCVITGNLLLRQGTEATGLKWRDITHRVDKEGRRFAEVRVRHGKMGGRSEPVISPFGRAYKQILDWQAKTLEFKLDSGKLRFGQPEDYVFPNWDGSEIPTHYMGRQFSRRLKEWNLNRHADGTNITLYSLRNTAISRRIIKSQWDVSQVAQAAGTSILQISSAYAYEWKLRNAERFATTHADGEYKPNKQVEDEQEELIKMLGIMSKRL